MGGIVFSGIVGIAVAWAFFHTTDRFGRLITIDLDLPWDVYVRVLVCGGLVILSCWLVVIGYCCTHAPSPGAFAVGQTATLLYLHRGDWDDRLRRWLKKASDAHNAYRAALRLRYVKAGA